MTPVELFGKIWEMMRDSSEDDENKAITRQAAKAEKAEPRKVSEINLNAGVPTVDTEEPVKAKKSSPLSSLRGSVKQDKSAEEQAALVSVHDQIGNHQAWIY